MIDILFGLFRICVLFAFSFISDLLYIWIEFECYLLLVLFASDVYLDLIFIWM